MKELFSTERLIDYFAIIDLEILKIDMEKNTLMNTSNQEETLLNVDYSHKSILQIPNINYEGSYELMMDSVFQVII